MLDNQFDLNVPVSKEQIADLKAQLRAIPMIRENIAKAKKAGIDVSSAEAELDDLERKAKAFISVYGS